MSVVLVVAVGVVKAILPCRCPPPSSLPSRPHPLLSSAFRLHWNIFGLVGNESAIMAISHISCALGGMLLALFCVGVDDLLMFFVVYVGREVPKEEVGCVGRPIEVWRRSLDLVAR